MYLYVSMAETKAFSRKKMISHFRFLWLSGGFALHGIHYTNNGCFTKEGALMFRQLTCLRRKYGKEVLRAFWFELMDVLFAGPLGELVKTELHTKLVNNLVEQTIKHDEDFRVYCHTPQNGL